MDKNKIKPELVVYDAAASGFLHTRFAEKEIREFRRGAYNNNATLCFHMKCSYNNTVNIKKGAAASQPRMQ